jgi:hypothetical protein
MPYFIGSINFSIQGTVLFVSLQSLANGSNEAPPIAIEFCEFSGMILLLASTAAIARAKERASAKSQVGEQKDSISEAA